MATQSKSITEKLNEYLQTSQHRSYFVIFVTLVFVIVMALFGILPAYSAFTLQGEENQKRQEAIDKLSKKLSDLKNLTTELQEKEDVVDYFDKIFPSEPTEEVVLNELIGMANASGTYLVEMGYKPNENLLRDFNVLGLPVNPNLKSLTLNITIDGSQQTINNFLRIIETKRRIYNVKNFNITRKTDQQLLNITADKYYNLVMNLEIYYFTDTPINTTP